MRFRVVVEYLDFDLNTRYHVFTSGKDISFFRLVLLSLGYTARDLELIFHDFRRWNDGLATHLDKLLGTGSNRPLSLVDNNARQGTVGPTDGIR
jgi:hypothetical protein